MTQKELINEVNEKLKNHKINYHQVDYAIKLGLISPKQYGRGIPREFSQEDVDALVNKYKDRG
jgi:hypothetical protein